MEMVKSVPPPQNKWQNRAEAAIHAALGTPNTDSPGGYVPAGMGPPQACQSPYIC